MGVLQGRREALAGTGGAGKGHVAGEGPGRGKETLVDGWRQPKRGCKQDSGKGILT